MSKDILIVDDEESIADVLKEVLEDVGLHVRTVTDERLLPTYVETRTPDLILLDVFIHDQDGRDICRDLKKSTATKHVPIIMMSAHLDKNTTVLESGADDFVKKPFDIDLLLEKIGKYVD